MFDVCYLVLGACLIFGTCDLGFMKKWLNQPIFMKN